MDKNDGRLKSAVMSIMFSLKNDEFLKYLIGTPFYRVSGPNKVDGGFSQDFATTVQGIYEVYRTRPDLVIDKKMEEEIEKLFGRPFLSYEVIPVLEELKYHLIMEKKNEAPFTLDCEKLFSILSKNIDTNKDRYIEDREYSKSTSLLEMLKDNDEFLKEKLDNNGFMKS